MLNSYFFRLNISYLECEALYQPGVNTCLIVSEQGAKVQIPTKNLRPFVTNQGIKGRFRLLTDANNKLKSFEKVA